MREQHCLSTIGVNSEHLNETSKIKRQQKRNNLFLMCYFDMMNCSSECCQTRAQHFSVCVRVCVCESESPNYTGLEIY